MSNGQFTTSAGKLSALTARFAEETTSTADVKRANRQRIQTRSTWIDLIGSINVSDEDDKEQLHGRNSRDWHSFDDDQIKIGIKLGRKSRLLRD